MGLPNVLSVDVEDYFHVEAFADTVNRADWDRYPSRVEANTARLLDLIDGCGVKATFFILGWVAERFPALVRRIVERGHEPGCHSYWHRLVYSLTPEEFREDTKRAKKAIEQAAGVPVRGYRAPSFSITRRTPWAPEVLTELGFQYDSSIFPVRHDIYGLPDAPRGPFLIETASGALLECPGTVFRCASRNLPVAGGGYLRIFPFWYTKSGMRRVRADGRAVISYVHPWEIDPEQPRLPGRLKSRLRHYTNLHRTARRLEKLMRLAPFVPFREFFSSLEHVPQWAFAAGPHPPPRCRIAVS